MHWSWSLFGWALLTGTLGAAGSYAATPLLRATHRWRAYRGLVVLTLALGVAAGLSGVAWIVVGFALYVGVANFAIPIALLPRLRREAPHVCSTQASCGATACATCPLAAQRT